MKTDLSSPVATAKFSKFAGILSTALSQHCLLGFEIAQMEFHHLHLLCSRRVLSRVGLRSQGRKVNSEDPTPQGVSLKIKRKKDNAKEC